MLCSESLVEERLPHRPLDLLNRVAAIRKRWRRLCSGYRLRRESGSIWRFNRERFAHEPEQGWKIHVSATILSACDVLAAACPVLEKWNVMFKTVASLNELARLNSGLDLGYSQIGKFMTVYPAGDEQFRSIIRELAEVMPANAAAPSVPFDFRYPGSTNLFFRFGGFATRMIETLDGRRVTSIRTPEGKLVEDRRDAPAPDWAALPIYIDTHANDASPNSPPATRYHVARAISQRGKGGVYEAIDTKSSPPRVCIIKEGRRHGETALDGRDGRDRIIHEANVLGQLKGKVTGTPEVIDSFEIDENFYLVTEKIEGETLQSYVHSNSRTLSQADRKGITQQIKKILAETHAAGWVWRDCKPANLIVCPDGSLRPIDFEGAAPINSPDPLPWNTPGFSPPDIGSLDRLKDLRSNLAEDEFALTACIAFVEESGMNASQVDQASKFIQAHLSEDLGEADVVADGVEERLDAKRGK